MFQNDKIVINPEICGFLIDIVFVISDLHPYGLRYNLVLKDTA